MTLLFAPITATTREQALADVDAAVRAGADAVELRLDYLADIDEPGVEAIRAAVGPRPILLTPRSRQEGGVWDADDMQRISRLIALAPHANMVDVELATWQRSANIRQKVEMAAHRAGHGQGPRLILSAHDFKQRQPDLYRLVARMNDTKACGVAKVVFQARHISECFELFDLMHSNPKPVIAIAMGEAGVVTRILAGKCGAFATFASVAAGKESAPGQVTLVDMKTLYRWDRVHRETPVYGVIGNPVAHSMSPAIHNRALDACDLDGVYVPLLIESTYDHFEDFLRKAAERPWFDLRGVSVTIPHKSNALRYALARGGEIEPLAKRIGAANTLTFDDGRVFAQNTDYAGALDALTDAMGCERADLRGTPVGVLGAGGVARGIVAGLTDCGCNVVIYNRTASRAKELADDFGCTAAPVEQRVRPGTKIVVNCTSIGMHPNVDEIPLPADRLAPDMVVFDTVYNPIETRLLREARGIGCRIVDGVAMFVHQAAAQFERWTGHPAPREAMRDVVVRRLKTNT
jgi:3-dehydroquinate dehydratase/shikimate dehydrogenase